MANRNLLNKYKRNITSEHGEDGIISYLVDLINDIPESILEVGAWDGVFGSNTHHYWHDKNWKALLIEGDEEKYNELVKNTNGYEGVTCVNKLITQQGFNSLDNIAVECGFPLNIGIVSIDIDSYDYYIWKYANKLNPSIVVIEHNQEIPPHIDYVDPEGHLYFRASAKALENLGIEKGYKLVACTVTNCIFVRNDLFNPDSMPDLPVEALFDYSRLAPQAIFAAMDDNKYPVFTRRTSSSVTKLIRFYYWMESIIKKNKRYKKPPPAVAEHMRKCGLDP